MNAQEMVGWALLALGLIFSLVPTVIEAVRRRSLCWLAVAPAMLVFWYEALLFLFWGSVIASIGALYPVAVWMSKALFIPWWYLTGFI